MTKQEALTLASIRGLKSEVETSMNQGLSPEDALLNWGILPKATTKEWYVDRDKNFYYITSEEAIYSKEPVLPLYKAIFSVDDAEDIIKAFYKKTNILVRIKEVDPSFTFCSFTNFN